MALYLTLLSLLILLSSKRLVLSNVSLHNWGIKYEKYLFLLVALFLCGGYMTGSDWRSYEVFYYDPEQFNYFLKEPLFTLLIKICNNPLTDFFVFLIAAKLIVFYILFYFFKKYSPNIFVSYFFYIPWFGLYLFIDNPLRFMIALGFVIISYKYLFEKNIWKFFVIIITGALFHYTVILFIPFYFIRKIKISPIVLTIIFIIWTFGFSAKNLFNLFVSTQDYMPLIFNLYS